MTDGRCPLPNIMIHTIMFWKLSSLYSNIYMLIDIYRIYNRALDIHWRVGSFSHILTVVRKTSEFKTWATCSWIEWEWKKLLSSICIDSKVIIIISVITLTHLILAKRPKSDNHSYKSNEDYHNTEVSKRQDYLVGTLRMLNVLW
jgi:hypothetical protein